MIDKIKVGKYLKSLRLSKKVHKNKKASSQTLEGLSEYFYHQKDILISVNAIKEWECGKSLPSPENLEVLSEYYGKTIDEILDGEDRFAKDFKETYFIFDNSWMHKHEKENLFLLNQTQIRQVTGNFKKLLKICIKRGLTCNEQEELKFLFENFYLLSSYGEEQSTIYTQNDFVKFLDSISHVLVETRNMNDDEKFWELQKLYTEKEKIQFSFWNEASDIMNSSVLKERFLELEDWQKDMYLAMFQNISPYNPEPDKYGADFLKRYEEQNGEFNKEKFTKDQMKHLILNGARLNKYFLNIKQKQVLQIPIIDRLEDLYEKCLKPIEIDAYEDDDNPKRIKIENTPKNRFIKNYYYSLRSFLKPKSLRSDIYSDLQEVYDFFEKNDELTDEQRRIIAERNDINTDVEKKYWMAEYKRRIDYMEKFALTEPKQKENDISRGLAEIDCLMKMLKSGKLTFTETTYETIGGKDEKTIRDHILFWKSKIDYEDFLNNRDEKLTKALLKDIDLLSLTEIKNKYFKEEIVDE